MKNIRTMVLIPIALFLVLVAGGCTTLFGDKPAKWDLPENPVERAAILGLHNSYRDSTLWEAREAEVLRVQPMVPTKAFVQEHDPQELYCVCVQYEARYRVPWTTKDRSPWERSVRNILVMKTKGGAFLAMRPSTICHPFCE